MVARASKVTAGIVIGGLCLWLVLQRVDMTVLWRSIAGADPLLLTLSVLFLVVAHVARAWAWIVLAGGLSELTVGKALRLTFVGNLANLVIPFRGGEIARVWLLGVRGGIGSVRAATVIVVERTLDMCVLFCLVAAGALLIGLPQGMGSGALRLALGGAAAIGSIVVAYATRHRIARAAKRIVGKGTVGTKVGRVLEQLGEGLDRFRARTTLAAAAAIVAFWLVVLVGLEIRLRAFDISTPFGGSVVILAAGNVAMSVPLVPAGIGIYEYTTVLCLEFMGIGAAVGLAFAVASHALSIAVTAIAGTISLVWEQAWRPRPVVRDKPEPPTDEPRP